MNFLKALELICILSMAKVRIYNYGKDGERFLFES